MLNAAESSPHDGVVGREVQSRIPPTVEKSIMCTRGPHYIGEQFRRGQRQCHLEGSGLEGMRRQQVVEGRGANSEPNYACEKI
jgi:hypothetical protein